MISRVFCILLSEALLAASLPLFWWFAFCVALNMVCIPLAEEPGLVKRFGADYLAYKHNVPRWIPRMKAWKGQEHRNC
jgi:protein-S-isoprenylcysteine O-methyltransferase Ste14